MSDEVEELTATNSDLSTENEKLKGTIEALRFEVHSLQVQLSASEQQVKVLQDTATTTWRADGLRNTALSLAIDARNPAADNADTIVAIAKKFITFLSKDS